tara:strand:+ start:864 stop:4319 length:3456 start_codon:yes stop_codon:yes gene_type:complete
MPDPINPQGINQGGQNVNKAQNVEQQAGIEEHTNKIIADLEQDVAETKISSISSDIQDKVNSYGERMASLSSNFEDDPESLTQEFVNRIKFCEESLLDLKERAFEAAKAERIIIQSLFQGIEDEPELFNKFSGKINGKLEITQEGTKLLEQMEKFFKFQDEAATYVIENPNTVSFDISQPWTYDNLEEAVQVYANTNPGDIVTLDTILDEFEIQDATQRLKMKQKLREYDESYEKTFESLSAAHKQFTNDINMLNQGEAYKRVLTQEKIKLSRALGIRVEIGNQFHVQDNNGNSKTFVIRGIHFKSTFFDKQRDLQLECEVLDSITSHVVVDKDSDVESILEYEYEGLNRCSLDKSLLENYNVYPKCDSFAELEERLGFRSMDQKFQPGTLFSYRNLNNISYTEILDFDFESKSVFLSEPIPTSDMSIYDFNAAIENKETDLKFIERSEKRPDGRTSYVYSLEEFLAFSYKHKAEEHVEAEIDSKKEILTSEELDRRLEAHHNFMLANGLALSKKPIQIHAGNVIGNLQGDKYEIKQVSPDIIRLENLSYPKYSGENPDNDAYLEFTLPELLKFIKDQNLGMISQEKIKRDWSINIPKVKSLDMPDFEWPEVPFGLMSLNDIVDISKVFGEKISQKRQRKRDLRKAGFQNVLGQEKESLEQSNQQFDKRVEFHKDQFKREGNSNTWNKELKKLSGFGNPENRAKLKALVDLLCEEGSLSVLDEDFIKLLNKARKKTRGVVTDPIKKKPRFNQDGEHEGEDWVDRDGTRNEDAVAEALNYIFNNNGQPSNFGTQCISKNRSAFTSSMNEYKSKTDRLAKEKKMDFNAEFGRLFSNLGSGKPMDAGEYTGILQAMIDEGYQDLENFFYYLYAGLCHEINGNGPILDDQFIESLNYGKHPYFHAFTVHKNILVGKKDEIWSQFSAGKNKLPNFKDNVPAKEGVQKFIWSYLLPLSTGSTKKHAKTAEGKNYNKECPGFVLSKLTNEQVEKVFSVGDAWVTSLSWNGDTMFDKHKDAFGQYAAGFKYAYEFSQNHSSSNDGTYIRNLLTSGIALFGLTHGRYKTYKSDGTIDDHAHHRAFEDEEINKLLPSAGMQNFRSSLKKVAQRLSVPVAKFLDDGPSKHLSDKASSDQAEQLIARIKGLSPKELAELVKDL